MTDDELDAYANDMQLLAHFVSHSLAGRFLAAHGLDLYVGRTENSPDAKPMICVVAPPDKDIDYFASRIANNLELDIPEVCPHELVVVPP